VCSSSRLNAQHTSLLTGEAKSMYCEVMAYVFKKIWLFVYNIGISVSYNRIFIGIIVNTRLYVAIWIMESIKSKFCSVWLFVKLCVSSNWIFLETRHKNMMIINVDKIKLCKCSINESVFDLNFVKLGQSKAHWSQNNVHRWSLGKEISINFLCLWILLIDWQYGIRFG
jgi:hypothetical protein